MKTMYTTGVLIASLFVATGVLRADDSSAAKAIEHPEVTYDKHMVNADAKDVQKDGMKVTEANQKVKEQKELVDQARKDYEKSLQSYGADNDVTKQAKSRYDSARKDYMKLAKKNGKAVETLQEDKADLHKAHSELQKDRSEAATQ